MPRVVVGGNEVDVHLTGVVPGRDFPLDRVLDLRNAVAGDPCPRCGAPLVVDAGDRDRPRLQARHQVLQGDGGDVPRRQRASRSRSIMGCYGIGVNRIVAAAVEAGHDDNGIIWPSRLAPYEVLLVPLQPQNPAVMEAAEALEKQLDGGRDRRPDRRPRAAPGRKFKDADLIGIPLRVVIGERGLKEGTIEVKWRTDAAAHHVAVGDGGRGDPGRAGGDPQGARRAMPSSAGSPAPRRGDDERPPPRGAPFVLLGLMTLATFGGPFAIVMILRGGASRELAPRPRRRVVDLRPDHGPRGRPDGRLPRPRPGPPASGGADCGAAGPHRPRLAVERRVKGPVSQDGPDPPRQGCRMP